MMRFPSISLALLSLALLATAAAPARAQSFAFERTLTVVDGATLDVRTERGKVNVRVGAPGRVLVEGTASVRVGWKTPANALDLAKAAADRPPITQEAQTVRLRPPSDAATRDAVTIAYTVTVPPETTVLAESDSGAIEIEGVRRAVTVRTGSSSITLSNLGATADVRTGSGATKAMGIQGLYRVTTQSSAIVADDLRGGLHARTGSGQIDASFRESGDTSADATSGANGNGAGAGDVDVRTESSAITLVNVTGGLVATTKSGRINVRGAPGRDWDVSTGSSAIDIALNPRAQATLDATTGSGSIQIDRRLALSGGAVDKRRATGRVGGEDGPMVRLTSRSGSIDVR